MKKIIILKHGGGELTNQLWNYISIYAYAKEINAQIINPSFFEYGCNFNIKCSPILNLLLYKPFANYTKRRSGLKRQIWRNMYKLYVFLMRIFQKGSIVSSINSNNTVYYLPPSIKDHLDTTKNTLYFEGWLFRNPEGIKKYRKEILEYFKPIPKIEKNVEHFLGKNINKHLVGVHIRQGDYKIFKDGRFYIEQKRVREIMDEYLNFIKKSHSEVVFIITSDGQIDEKQFMGLQYKISHMGPVEDLFLLSKTKTILGSDSSFGNLASYFGDIPHIVFNKEKMDWNYYSDKNKYFKNKYCTMVHY
ncbi:alpha-1,2-fucosyltransferase [Patescibacteria group bacterium]|nr:alpha-1,2-fucosyltransferase [Patescibacteria group bacterium]MBU4115783.1 alpha-1,2-fucosyltransferase [Patescibacteria group bacterium]